MPVAGIWARIVAEKGEETDVTTTGSVTRSIRFTTSATLRDQA